MKKIFFQFNIPHHFSAVLYYLVFLFSTLPAFADTVRDEFTALSYTNNNGSANWATDWLEITEADGANTGDIQVIDDLGSGRLRISSNNKGVQREVNLSGATVATLTFDYRSESLDRGNEYVNLEISSDGGASWTELVRYKGPQTDASYQSSLSYDITPYISANTRIRLIGSANLDSADAVYFDNIEIDYTSPSLTHFAISHDGTGDNCLPEQITITKHTAAHTIDTTYTGTISISTSTGNGNWTKTTTATDAEGILSAGTIDSGIATYTFVAADNGSITLNLENINVETLNINITDGTDTESSAEDADLSFSSLSTVTYRDEFLTISYANNNGSALWASDWLEIVETDGAGTGDIQISSGQIQISGSNKGVQRAVDLTGATTATLTLNHRRVSLEGGEYVNLEISSDGGVSWTELDRFKGPQNDVSNQSTSYNITPYISATTRIRLLGSTSLDSTTDVVYFDNIEIASSFVVACSSVDHFSINYLSGATGTGVNCQAEYITIEAHDSSHNVNTTYTGTIILSTSTINGDWFNTSTASDALGSFTAGIIDSGAATYTYVASDNGSIVLNFKDTHTETVNINIAEGTTTETSNSALASDDYEIAFASTGFNFLATGVKNTIGTQIGGKSSNLAPNIQILELQAIKTSDQTGACESAFQNPTAVEIAIECIDPINCTGNNLYISSDAGTTFNQIDSTPELTYTSITGFDFGTATDTTASFIIRYDDAGKIKLHARKILTPSNEQMLGSSNEFVVRPFGFVIDFSGQRTADYADNGTLDDSTGTNLSYAINASGTLFRKAGEDFTATLTAVQWQAIDDTDNNGVADTAANLTDNTPTQNFGNETTAAIPANISATPATTLVPNAGVLTNSTNSATFTNGIGTKTLAWSEAGIVNITTLLTNYLASGEDINGNVQNVGRFVPDYFNTTVIEGCIVNNNYTYSAQPFSVSAIAKNTTGGTTLNYNNTYAFTTTVSNAGIITNFTNNTIPAGNFNNGIGTRTDVTYTFTAKKTIPEIITLRARDTDTLTASGTIEGTTEIRSGRARLENIFGSELTSLTMPLNIEYYSDNTLIADTSDDGFMLNTDDSCTTYDATLGALTNYTGNLSAGETTVTGAGTVAAGEANIAFSAPGTDNEGSVNLLLNNTSSPGWLTYSWNVDCDNADADDDITTGIDAGMCGPFGTASFGLYRGDDRIIYWREIF
ncbi:MAG: hypothetical protein KAT06_11345 [Gammaproteobacteria bacterium]|nr:hypothetical protein [Gammaproteobacteria bacterium]